MLAKVLPARVVTMSMSRELSEVAVDDLVDPKVKDGNL